MIFQRLRWLSLLLALTAGPALAASRDETLLNAYDAYRAGDPVKYARYAKKLRERLLAPWVAYWGLSLRLDEATPAEVAAFFKRYGETYSAERLRYDWLKVLGKRGEWPEFERQLARYPRVDLEISCYAWLARLARGEWSAYEEASAMWLEPRELPEGCERLAARMRDDKRISADDVWRRARVLFENGQITAAKETLDYLPRADAPDEHALADAARHPERILGNLPARLEPRAMREVVVLAAVRQARDDPDAAAEVLDKVLAAKLPPSDVSYLWGRIGFEAARIHDENALKWYAHAAGAVLDDEELAWKVRAALRAGDWAVVRDTVEQMPSALQHSRAWTYWYGRALDQLGQPTRARALFLRLAGEPTFYGLLADDELGHPQLLPAAKYTPSGQEVAEAKHNPGLARALELIRLGVRTEGVREWLFTIRSFSDRKLLAAAELARRAEVYDRAIHTADRTEHVHNYSLRYPVPFRDMFRRYARTHQLDEAWVLGLVRQESRFIADARSSAGARGLMQVMPHTARFIASKIGIRHYRHGDVAKVPTNIKLGTGYLKLVLDELGHPVLASAAYNAGPSRASRWQGSKPLEGAIYAETIPFPETRDYVEKVMANSVFYSVMLGKKNVSLRALLGVIPARSSAEAIPDDLP